MAYVALVDWLSKLILSPTILKGLCKSENLTNALYLPSIPFLRGTCQEGCAVVLL
jgi:hypothetical protein